jgi:hypothetical protein
LNIENVPRLKAGASARAAVSFPLGFLFRVEQTMKPRRKISNFSAERRLFDHKSAGYDAVASRSLRTIYSCRLADSIGNGSRSGAVTRPLAVRIRSETTGIAAGSRTIARKSVQCAKLAAELGCA